MACRQFADILADDATLLYFIRHLATSRRRSIGCLVFRACLSGINARPTLL
ncbi:hypothetical protein [Kingella sp. (in: b-proteobacteria)]|uniref:hypothetical protein n=1 Tax=Kingella sp. (in: b-proteobacteria) TaxID=2020713 RepID=UPI0026DABBF4|nr:hypothetical protein [Kingella sp. (in: b-proteobacteria)]MDO4657751.1 hypothetical protein [Kingella sp. (in: b-proteobacteria)]